MTKGKKSKIRIPDPLGGLIPGGAIASAIRRRQVRRGEAISQGPLKNSPTRVPPGKPKPKPKRKKKKQ